VIKKKSLAFAVDIVQLCKFLTDNKKEYIMSKQLIKSGTAVGALVRESEHAESPLDFIHKLSIALKEANESVYWLELLKEVGYISIKTFEKYKTDCQELVKILVSIIKSSKAKLTK
ncbi:four helix bundle protein, partial [Bacteroidota bacterium]